ncbi:MAG TPA: GtrA family protein [Xanthomonadaceae bacterium]|jgi:putative flippase GtrA
MWQRLRSLHSKSGVRFVIAGITQLLLDWSLFVALSASGVPTLIANPVARCCVVGFGFWLHGVYTFAGDGTKRVGWGQLARYIPTWIALTVTGTLALGAIGQAYGLHAAWIAKPFIEAMLAVVSFLVLRGWVFRAARRGVIL